MLTMMRAEVRWCGSVGVNEPAIGASMVRICVII